MHLETKLSPYALCPRTQRAQEEKRRDPKEPFCFAREHL
jgi:hypothetical protein